MAVSKEDVLAALAAVPGPDGTPLPRTGKLSDIVVTDGKVFFSITVQYRVTLLNSRRPTGSRIPDQKCSSDRLA